MASKRLHNTTAWKIFLGSTRKTRTGNKTTCCGGFIGSLITEKLDPEMVEP
jgi:hypothetical protein